MKKHHFITVMLLISCVLLLLTACQTTKLDTPSRLMLDDATLVLSWNKVENARYYKVVIDGDGKNDSTLESTKASVDLSKLGEGNYSIKVIACGNGDQWRDSKPSESFSFVREYEAGFIFSLTGGQSYSLTSMGAAEVGEDGTVVIPNTYRGKPVTEIGDKAFFNKVAVKKVVLGENIERIGKQAFANCTNLTSIAFSQSLETIDASAFQSCKGLAGALCIPNSVTAIGEYAFASCEKITSLDLGEGLQSIPASAFIGCKALDKIFIPKNVKSIGQYAFSDNYNVREIVIENGLEEIGSFAFAHNRGLTKLIVPDSVTSIGEGAFMHCQALSDVTFGTGLSSVGVNAFYKSGIFNNTPTGQPVYVANWFVGYNTLDAEDKAHPEMITNVLLKDTTVGIADQALYNHKSFTTVSIPDSVKVIGYKAFANCQINVLKLGSGVRMIGERAFYGCTKLQLAVLGAYNELSGVMTDSNLEKIGDYAFYGCSNLKDIKIPGTVKEIGCYAFRNTLMYSSQTGIIYAAQYDSASRSYIYDGAWVVDHASATLGSQMQIQDGTVGIAGYSFYKSAVLKKILIPETVKYIGRSAFYLCAALEDMELPDQITRIEDYTFYGCAALKPFKLPGSLTYIGRSAFYKALLADKNKDTQTDTLVIPDTVTYIGDYAFYNTGISGIINDSDEDEGEMQEVIYGIDKIIIGNGVEYIGTRAFYGSISLKEVVLGEKLTTLGARAFYNCKLLQAVTFPENSVLETISDSAFYGCESLQQVRIPHSVTIIERNAFYKCTGMVQLDLGSVQSIGQAAFYGCAGVTQLHIPQTVSHIGKQAFRNCSGLLGVAVENDQTTIDQHAFYGCANMTVYTDGSADGENWKTGWNSTHCPIVWGCTLSEDGTYVYAVTKTESFVTMKDISKVLTAPTREGYTFAGWAYEAENTQADLSMEDLLTVADGTTVYAVWTENTAEEANLNSNR